MHSRINGRNKFEFGQHKIQNMTDSEQKGSTNIGDQF